MPAAQDPRHETWRRVALACGIASSLHYAAMIWLIRYEGYSSVFLLWIAVLGRRAARVAS